MYVLPFLAKYNSRVCLSETKLYTNLRFAKHYNAYIKKKTISIYVSVVSKKRQVIVSDVAFSSFVTQR